MHSMNALESEPFILKTYFCFHWQSSNDA